jgi:hypothetical protein
VLGENPIPVPLSLKTKKDQVTRKVEGGKDKD